jgi:DNA-binding CsgD family transcriptional regulator
VVALRRPLVVNDHVSSQGISHRYDHIITAEGLRAMVAVPVMVRRTVRGVLYGAVRSTVPLGDRVVQAIVNAARDLEQNLAVREELTRRLDWLDHRAVPEETARPQWELVREAYAELRILAKDTDDAHVRERVESVCEKLSTLGSTDSRPRSAPALSPRELDVIACVALGWTNARIANDLDLSVETVKSYLRSAMAKLLARSRLEAVVAARRLGLLP